MEKPKTRALINSFLDYLSMSHGAFVEVAVKDWIDKKDERLKGLRQEQESLKEKDIQTHLTSEIR